MVNEVRSSLLEAFQNSRSWISGESLSRRYGISRVAIWKHIKALQNEGYRIESGHKGYKLIEGDNLSAMDFPPAEGIRFYKELGSTLSEARSRMGGPGEDPEDFLILAERQSGGIGRQETEWRSPEGGVYMACVLNRPLLPSAAGLVPFRGILSVLQTLEEPLGEAPAFRWPGDLMLRERKIGGVLEEYFVRGGKVLWYALGIGVHMNDSLEELAPGGMASVAGPTGQRVRRKEFIRRFRERWKENLLLPPEEVGRGLTPYAPFLGSPLRLETAQGVFRGIPRRIDEEGFLRLDSGEEELRISIGETIQTTMGEKNE